MYLNNTVVRIIVVKKTCSQIGYPSTLHEQHTIGGIREDALKRKNLFVESQILLEMELTRIKPQDFLSDRGGRIIHLSCTKQKPLFFS